MPWQLTVRSGSRVNRTRYEDLAAALDAAEAAVSEAVRGATARSVDAKLIRFEPAQQVLARLELAGPERLLPSIRAGIDVHGDGSTSAYRGRVRRRALDAQRGERAIDVLRRTALQHEG